MSPLDNTNTNEHDEDYLQTTTEKWAPTLFPSPEYVDLTDVVNNITDDPSRILDVLRNMNDSVSVSTVATETNGTITRAGTDSNHTGVPLAWYTTPSPVSNGTGGMLMLPDDEEHIIPHTASEAIKLVFSSSASLINDTMIPIAERSNFSNHRMNNTDLNKSLDLLSNTDDILPEGFIYPSGHGWLHLILSAFVVTLIIMSIVVGNIMVMVAIAKDRNLNQVQNYFIGSLALSDLLLGGVIMPFSLANELMGYWFFGDILCDVWLSTDVLLSTASILNLCLISLDRYWSVTRAVSYARTRTHKRAWIMIATVWLLSAIICFPPLAGWKRPQPTKYGFPLCVLSSEIGYVVYSTMGSFYIPLIVMVVVYVKIYIAARSRARRNLRKKVKQCHDNGKASSNTTTTTTTTSFVNPNCKPPIDGKHSPLKISFSDDETEAEPTPIPVDPSGTDSETPTDAMRMKMTVTNHSAHLRSGDEKRQLLAEDTDSACDTPSKRHAGGARLKVTPSKHIHFSEDTDSATEYQSYTDKYPNYQENAGSVDNRSGNEDNMQPLLDDSQPDSESQKDSDRNGNSMNKLSECEDDQKDSDTSNLQDTHMNIPQQATLSTTPRPQSTTTSSHAPSLCARDHRRKMDLLSPTHIRKLSLRRQAKEKPAIKDDPDRMKRKLARARERRATLVLGIIMITFIICWLPFFSLYVITVLTGLDVPGIVFAITFWAGYCNSALNPIIYTIFNRDFRHAFHKLICGRRK